MTVGAPPSLFFQGKLFGSSNPFDWMELISLQGKTNFFEKRVTWDRQKKTTGRGEDFPSPFGGTAIFVGYITSVCHLVFLLVLFFFHVVSLWGRWWQIACNFFLDLQICRWCTSNHTRTDHDLDPLQHEPHEHHFLYLFVMVGSEQSQQTKEPRGS